MSGVGWRQPGVCHLYLGFDRACRKECWADIVERSTAAAGCGSGIHSGARGLLSEDRRSISIDSMWEIFGPVAAVGSGLWSCQSR